MRPPDTSPSAPPPLHQKCPPLGRHGGVGGTEVETGRILPSARDVLDTVPDHACLIIITVQQQSREQPLEEKSQKTESTPALSGAQVPQHHLGKEMSVL